jgi:hypothetical protein
MYTELKFSSPLKIDCLPSVVSPIVTSCPHDNANGFFERLIAKSQQYLNPLNVLADSCAVIDRPIKTEFLIGDRANHRSASVNEHYLTGRDTVLLLDDQCG